MMNRTDLKEKILEGTRLAIKRLVEKKQREDAYLVVSEKGKVTKVKARDIKLR